MSAIYIVWGMIPVLSLSLVGCASIGKKDLPAPYAIQGQGPVRISVMQFTNQSASTDNANGGCRGWYWFNGGLGHAFQDAQILEFSRYPKLKVLERESIHAIYDKEVNLVNSKNSSHKIKKNQFEKARYTLVGVVSEFEYCDGSGGVDFQTSSLPILSGLSAGQEKAKVKVIMRLIDTETGSVISSSEGVGEQKRARVGGVAGIEGFSMKATSYQQTALGEAIQHAIADGTKSLFQKANL